MTFINVSSHCSQHLFSKKNYWKQIHLALLIIFRLVLDQLLAVKCHIAQHNVFIILIGIHLQFKWFKFLKFLIIQIQI